MYCITAFQCIKHFALVSNVGQVVPQLVARNDVKSCGRINKAYIQMTASVFSLHESTFDMMRMFSVVCDPASILLDQLVCSCSSAQPLMCLFSTVAYNLDKTEKLIMLKEKKSHQVGVTAGASRYRDSPWLLSSDHRSVGATLVIDLRRLSPKPASDSCD